MIYKLQKKDYQRVRALLQTPEQKNDWTLNAIINGTNRGMIYVDDIEKPRTAMIDVTGVITMFIGDATNEKFITPLRDFIDNQLKEDTYESCEGTHFLTVVKEESWEKALLEVISHRDFEIDYEWYYQFNESCFYSLKESHKLLPRGYEIRRIDADVISNDPDEMMIDVLNECWYSVDKFLEQGFGYCVMKEGRIVSACLSCCVNGKDHEISVETYNEEEQNKGLATSVCAVYLEHCIEQGVVPHWSTLETNIESKQLAKKLGFEFESKSKTVEFEF
ncbi:GNAT family N-acetyltransferase [Bacillus sp. Hm123]|uniref:GNAT family N-acetyltransferase n=1 Tax=Bacillus sp. Hm123 TaxID=3450745 RepID=UPI003F43027A